MQIKFIAILAGSLFLSTALEAIKSKESPSTTINQTILQKDSRQEQIKQLKQLKRVNSYNNIFHNYSNGGDHYDDK